MPATITLSQLAANLGAEVDHGLADPVITGVSSIAAAGPGCLVFAEEEVSFAAALASSAAAVLVSAQVAVPSGSKPVLRVPQPRLAFARAAVLLRVGPPSPSIHATAVVARGAQIAAGVSIGPHAFIEEGASIGAATTIGSGVVIGVGVSIGSHCRIYPRVVIYSGVTLGDRVVIHAGAVLGADGFGYVRDRASGEYTQFPQQGTLIIEDDVEVGANTTIDRGALEETRIARGTKLDNLIHIGHNCNIGTQCRHRGPDRHFGFEYGGRRRNPGRPGGHGRSRSDRPRGHRRRTGRHPAQEETSRTGNRFLGNAGQAGQAIPEGIGDPGPAGIQNRGKVDGDCGGGRPLAQRGKDLGGGRLIARLPERNWTACKITQFGHGFCSANGEPCDCQTDEHTIAISAERDPNTGTDSARFLAAGAKAVALGPHPHRPLG